MKLDKDLFYGVTYSNNEDSKPMLATNGYKTKKEAEDSLKFWLKKHNVYNDNSFTYKILKGSEVETDVITEKCDDKKYIKESTFISDFRTYLTENV